MRSTTTTGRIIQTLNNQTVWQVNKVLSDYRDLKRVSRGRDRVQLIRLINMALTTKFLVKAPWPYEAGYPYALLLKKTLKRIKRVECNLPDWVIREAEWLVEEAIEATSINSMKIV